MSENGAFKSCQSCGMPLKRDEVGGGTNADGSRSRVYCSHCYRGGTFTRPGLTAVEMQDHVRGKLKEFGIPGFVAGLLVRKIPRLKRWNGETTP